MNPGLLNQQITLLRKTDERDELGQPLDTWTAVGTCRARRMKPKAQPETQLSDRPTESQTVTFRVRTRPFVQLYQPGDRLQELARADILDGVWEIVGFAVVDSTNSAYSDITSQRNLCSN